MAKAKNKTQSNDGDPAQFIASISDEAKRGDAETLLKLMQSVTGEAPKMWGASIVGFGERHLVYESGREVDWFVVGFSPRKQNFALYVMDGFEDHEETLSRLGKYSTGKACLYLKRLDDIDLEVLKELVTQSVKSQS